MTIGDEPRDSRDAFGHRSAGFVDAPDEVEVEGLISDERGAAFRVEANHADVGRLIGKGGQTARALQAIINANASRSGRRFQIEFDRALDE